VPASRVNDTVYFNPSDMAYPVALNLLEPMANIPAPVIAGGILAALRKTWPDFWGPRMEYVLRSAILTLLEFPQSTIVDLHRLLADERFRKLIVRRVRDPQLKQFWEKEFGMFTGMFRNEAVSPILNKTGQYLSTPMLRNILGQRERSLSLRDLMDRGAVILVNLARGRLGEDTTTLLGALLVTQLQLAALSRAEQDEQDRRDFFLYVDEAQLMANRTMVELFPEARKFHLGVVFAHQFLDQLDESLRFAILGNVGTLIVFRVGARDADALAPEFSPEFREHDLVSLPAYHMYLRLMIDGMTSRPFSAVSLPTSAPRRSLRQEIITETRRRFARSVAEVEREVLVGWQSTGIDRPPGEMRVL
jgi:hypothetical protein